MKCLQKNSRIHQKKRNEMKWNVFIPPKNMQFNVDQRSSCSQLSRGGINDWASTRLCQRASRHPKRPEENTNCQTALPTLQRVPQLGTSGTFRPSATPNAASTQRYAAGVSLLTATYAILRNSIQNALSNVQWIQRITVYRQLKRALNMMLGH